MSAVSSASKITAASVSDLFRKTYRRGPWPDEAGCQRLAEFLKATGPRISRNERSLRRLMERREVVTSVRRVISAQRRELELYQRDLATFVASSAAILNRLDRALDELDSAVAAATPVLYYPLVHRTGSHLRAVWHHEAFAIYRLAVEALGKAKQPQGKAKQSSASLDRNGPLVRFITAALQEATGKKRSKSTVSAALNDIVLGKRSRPFPRKSPPDLR